MTHAEELEKLTALLAKHGRDVVGERFWAFIHQKPGLGPENYGDNQAEYRADCREVAKQAKAAEMAWKFAFGTPWGTFEPDKLAKAMLDYGMEGAEEGGRFGVIHHNEPHNFRGACCNCLYQSIGSTTRYKG